MELENINPSVYKRSVDRPLTKDELDEKHVDPIDSREVFGKKNDFAKFHRTTLKVKRLL